ncbi:rRNA methyltransferase [Candidatus Aerophobetes bacterium]|uniref:rRNA methyltransferase n=1 Tax=Aerophobetes bacterium TaxID=2030807 RepID=A0A2A4WWX3_UNCAE|nr:MAG: rRNA methyltransferase [Candidatus Aerophobetes bacterium]
MPHKNHLTTAHALWLPHLKPGSTVIDATAGNGHDALFIAKHLLHQACTELICIDIQEKALLATKTRLSSLPTNLLSKITYIHGSHASLPPMRHPLSLIVYNLGYLPGSDKTVTTRVDTTLESVKNSLNTLAPGGLISLTLYPGHREGKEEYQILIPFLKALSPKKFQLSHPSISNTEHSPKLFVIKSI